MTYEEFLDFGFRVGYPCLLLGNGDILKSGRDEWFRFLRLATWQRLENAMQRAEAMRARMAESETSS